MDEVSVRAVLARAPELCASHVHALVAAAGGDITRSIELDALAAVDLPPSTRSSLVFPDSTTLDSDLRWIRASGAQLLANGGSSFRSRSASSRAQTPLHQARSAARMPRRHHVRD